MKPIDFPEANMTFGAPSDMPNCKPLRGFLHDQGILSCWELSDEDLEIVNSTKRIWVNVLSNQLTPMSMSPAFPFAPPDDYPDTIPE